VKITYRIFYAVYITYQLAGLIPFSMLRFAGLIRGAVGVEVLPIVNPELKATTLLPLDLNNT
jgi:hypothetical protein